METMLRDEMNGQASVILDEGMGVSVKLHEVRRGEYNRCCLVFFDPDEDTLHVLRRLYLLPSANRIIVCRSSDIVNAARREPRVNGSLRRYGGCGFLMKSLTAIFSLFSFFARFLRRYFLIVDIHRLIAEEQADTLLLVSPLYSFRATADGSAVYDQAVAMVDIALSLSYATQRTHCLFVAEEGRNVRLLKLEVERNVKERLGVLSASYRWGRRYL